MSDPLVATSTHQLPPFLYSCYGIKAKPLSNFVVIPGQSTNSFLQKLQIRGGRTLLFGCKAWKEPLFYPKGGYYSAGKAFMCHSVGALECM